MRTLKLIMLCCLSLAFLACGKTDKPTLSTEFTVEVTDITAINARLAIDATGDKPSLVRYMAPVPEAEVKAAISMDDAEALKALEQELDQASADEEDTDTDMEE